jgi:carbonic anhydrase
MVLAHSQCGAVSTVVNSLQEKNNAQNEEDTHLHELFKHITPVVQSIIQNEKHPADIQQFINLCACEHAKNIAQRIREISKPIVEAEQRGEIKIVPAFYELETGRVFYLD